MVESDQGSGDGLASGPVVPDRGGQRQQALGDAGTHSVDAAPAVQFQVELALRVSFADSISWRMGLMTCPGAAGPLTQLGLSVIVESIGEDPR